MPLAQVLDIESEFWTELKIRFEPLPDKNVFISMSEKAALMLNGATFERFFNHAEFSPCVSDIWECGPQNELVGFDIRQSLVKLCRKMFQASNTKQTI